MSEYPPPTPKPCNDCPWRKIAIPGWLGPYPAERWLEIAHGESPVACHQTITEVNDEGVGMWDHPAMRQCRGVAIFREHVCKSPRHPDIETGPTDPDNVFVTNAEFMEYHTGQPVTDEEAAQIVNRIRYYKED